MTQNPATDRTTLRRIPDRGSHDAAVIRAILDEALVCHVAFPFQGSLAVLPTAFVRVDQEVFLHGSAASGMLRALAAGQEVSVAVTILDGLVLARSAFHHSMNYRSVVIFGKGRVVEGEEKPLILGHFMEKVAPGRSAESREANDRELRSTLLIGISISEASAKIRTGPPIDDEEDYSLPYWAGVVPIRSVMGTPEADPRITEQIEVPDHVLAMTHDSPRARPGTRARERRSLMSLEMRTSCERCDQPLPADGEAHICSYECTFCRTCNDEMNAICPNCGGELVRRPRRNSSGTEPLADTP